MYISKLSIRNYRNFNSATLHFKKGVNTVIGENGSGKSNLLRAIRLLLDDAMVGKRNRLTPDDFWRGLGDWRGHWIIIQLEFADVSNDEEIQSLLLHVAAEEANGKTNKATYTLVYRPDLKTRQALATVPTGDCVAMKKVRDAITPEDYEQCLFGRMSFDLTCKSEYERVVGDFEGAVFQLPNENGYLPSDGPDIGTKIPRELSLSREFSLSFVPALRDVVSDFSDSRRNPLKTLLNAKSSELPEGDFHDIVDRVNGLNLAIQERQEVQDIENGIITTFRKAVGETFSPTTMKIQSELPIDAEDLFRSLKLYVGEHGENEPRRLHEMSLGGANLVYLTLKLLEFKYKSSRQPVANFLLIEEPEAHIHTHVQKTLFDRVKYDDTQIIYSTHSPQISEVSEIDRVNVLSQEGSGWVALQPAIGLNENSIRDANRFLDAIRSNLLFARSVLLVEGDAEELLIPSLIKKIYGVTLDEIGLTVVNVRSTGFETLVNLFGSNRLRKRCSILTDYDQPFFDVEKHDEDSDKVVERKIKAQKSAESGVSRKSKLDSLILGNPFVKAFYAQHTFEVAFANASESNLALLEAVIPKVYNQESKKTEVSNALQSGELAQYGAAALKLANRAGKGWFALVIAAGISENGLVLSDDEDMDASRQKVEVPTYILDAIAWAVGELPWQTWHQIFLHRLGPSAFENDLDIAELDSPQSKVAAKLKQDSNDPPLNALIQAFGNANEL